MSERREIGGLGKKGERIKQRKKQLKHRQHCGDYQRERGWRLGEEGKGWRTKCVGRELDFGW